jgi:hypothetical protein
MRKVRAAAFWTIVCAPCSIAEFAAAAEPAGASSQAAAKAAYHNQLICKTKASVGSHIPKRTCKTQAQIDRERMHAQRQLKEVQAPHPVSSVGEAGRGY